MKYFPVGIFSSKLQNTINEFSSACQKPHLILNSLLFSLVIVALKRVFLEISFSKLVSRVEQYKAKVPILPT